MEFRTLDIRVRLWYGVEIDAEGLLDVHMPSISDKGVRPLLSISGEVSVKPADDARYVRA